VRNVEKKSGVPSKKNCAATVVIDLALPRRVGHVARLSTESVLIAVAHSHLTVVIDLPYAHFAGAHCSYAPFV
jgi:hypothetical protein